MAYWLGITFGLAFLLAVFPFGSIELFVVGLVVREPEIPWLALGVCTAAGQVLGKVVHYYAARGVVRLPAFTRADAKPQEKERTGWRARAADWMAMAMDRAQERPGWMFGVFSVSTVVGLPPFGATTVLAGVVKMRMPVFLAVALPGRCIRYCALAAAPPLVASLLF
ncbi:hypothetical protein [Labedaea rhizosphaerae]|uniref:Membrane protein YqaA with SNARE-associated domain n=1 Tax=Labedaea rhizosphaerae TaxID=598644 RepID=A0A4V3CZN9_LABRH|nr:hypothetical protein [Labedaea rhizosphaerae]TDQ00491.1 membrane protein YqaA with SNARE-associated domain [Labedaea rhizosphaerae]